MGIIRSVRIAKFIGSISSNQQSLAAPSLLSQVFLFSFPPWFHFQAQYLLSIVVDREGVKSILDKRESLAYHKSQITDLRSQVVGRKIAHDPQTPDNNGTTLKSLGKNLKARFSFQSRIKGKGDLGSGPFIGAAEVIV